jgi:hypothetical protein
MVSPRNLKANPIFDFGLNEAYAAPMQYNWPRKTAGLGLGINHHRDRFVRRSTSFSDMRRVMMSSRFGSSKIDPLGAYGLLNSFGKSVASLF